MPEKRYNSTTAGTFAWALLTSGLATLIAYTVSRLY